MLDGVARFRDVEVIEDAGNALLCTVSGKRVWVPVLEIRYGTEVGKLGDRGNLVIPRRVAERIGLAAAKVHPESTT